MTDPCPDPRPYGLGLVLDAARAPARTEELADEQRAVARLVAARRVALAANPVRRRDATAPPTIRKCVVGLATGLALVIAITGIAAGSGSLPTALQQRAHDMFAPLGVPAPGGDDDPGGGPSVTPDPAPTTPVISSPSPSGGAGPAPTVTGAPDPNGAEARALCQSWGAAGRDPNGVGMTDPSWRALVTTAGGKARVPALCTALIGDPTNDATGSTGNGSRTGGGPAMPSQSAGGKKRGQP